MKASNQAVVLAMVWAPVAVLGLVFEIRPLLFLAVVMCNFWLAVSMILDRLWP